jgi:hypothetical protein
MPEVPVVTVVIVEPEVFMNLSENISIGGIVVVTGGRVVVTGGRVVVTGGRVVVTGGRVVVTGGPVVVEGAFFGSTLNEILYEPVQRVEGLQQTPTLRRNSPGFALPESKGSLPIASSLVVSKFPLGS